MISIDAFLICALKPSMTSNVENNLINDGRIGNFYKYVNKKLNGSNGIAPLRNNDGHYFAVR